MKPINNRGNINPEDWIISLSIFAMTYLVFSYTQPIVTALIAATGNMNLPSSASSVLTYAQTMYQYGLIISAITAILYLLLSAIRVEGEDRLNYGGY